MRAADRPWRRPWAHGCRDLGGTDSRHLTPVAILVSSEPTERYAARLAILVASLAGYFSRDLVASRRFARADLRRPADLRSPSRRARRVPGARAPARRPADLRSPSRRARRVPGARAPAPSPRTCVHAPDQLGTSNGLQGQPNSIREPPPMTGRAHRCAAFVRRYAVPARDRRRRRIAAHPTLRG
jgi:hypothetical protein